MIDVLVVDDSAVLRKYLEHLLQREPDIRVVGRAARRPWTFLKKILFMW
jgi:chemotaxis response regulator CheB